MTDGIDELRERIIEAALPHVPFDGWTQRAMRRGAEAIGYDDATARRAFPYGAADMVREYSRMLDRRTAEALAGQGLDRLRVRERVAAGVTTRLELMAPHREAVRRALSVLALPLNAPLGMRCLYDTVDLIWRAAGDTATDWNFYTKRTLLAGVYSSTVLYWLDDKSEDYADTRAFLDRRIEDAMRLPRTLSSLVRFPACFSRPVRGYRM
jgi:ubiquinone biosynthesis protein COQ9